MGLLAVWREGLLAQKVLTGQTKGYRHHPQLRRFQARKDPVAAISVYLWGIADEARSRGYEFDASKIARKKSRIQIPVTRGQMEFERGHLKKKLKVRDRTRLSALKADPLKPHPALRVVAGDVEEWEIT